MMVFCLARIDAGTFFVVYALRTVCLALFNRGLNLWSTPQKFTTASGWCLVILACGVGVYLLVSHVSSAIHFQKPWQLLLYAALSALYSAIALKCQDHLKENFVDFHLQGISSAVAGLLATIILGRTIWGIDEDVEDGRTWAYL